MTPMKLAWHSEGGRLSGDWVKADGPDRYTAEWMNSDYPSHPMEEKSLVNLLERISPLGKPRMN